MRFATFSRAPEELKPTALSNRGGELPERQRHIEVPFVPVLLAFDQLVARDAKDGNYRHLDRHAD
jgi:hypothetical protein